MYVYTNSSYLNIPGFCFEANVLLFTVKVHDYDNYFYDYLEVFNNLTFLVTHHSERRCL